MGTPFIILGIAGSLRKASFNRAVLRAAEQLVPDGVSIEVFDLEGIPLFNQDLEAHLPDRVGQLKQRVRAADAILLVTPEYNYSMPGVLKNAIDWASRPYGDNAWEGKPVAIMGASIGAQGTSRAQYHLRQVFVFLDMYPLNRPEVMITNAAQRFDENGRLKDEETKAQIHQLLATLVAWARHHEGGRRATGPTE